MTVVRQRHSSCFYVWWCLIQWLKWSGLAGWVPSTRPTSLLAQQKKQRTSSRNASGGALRFPTSDEGIQYYVLQSMYINITHFSHSNTSLQHLWGCQVFCPSRAPWHPILSLKASKPWLESSGIEWFIIASRRNWLRVNWFLRWKLKNCLRYWGGIFWNWGEELVLLTFFLEGGEYFLFEGW